MLPANLANWRSLTGTLGLIEQLMLVRHLIGADPRYEALENSILIIGLVFSLPLGLLLI